MITAIGLSLELPPLEHSYLYMGLIILDTCLEPTEHQRQLTP